MTTKTKGRVSEFPKGWDQKRVQALIDHYENQTEDEALAEDEAARKGKGGTYVFVPDDLVAEIRETLAKAAKRKGTLGVAVGAVKPSRKKAVTTNTQK